VSRFTLPNAAFLVSELTAKALTSAVFAEAGEGEIEEEIKMADDLMADWLKEEAVEYGIGSYLGKACETVAE
jgi:hypothetical protein